MIDRDLLLSIIESDKTEPAAPKAPRCRHLLSKGMFINCSLSEADRIVGDGYFWCAKTQRIYGPDDQLIGDGECRVADRSCYEGT
jgi:hypothetical protein